MKIEKRLAGTGLLTAFAASLCCIIPVLAIIAGTSGIASYISWLEPLRPYFICLTIVVLAYAWYQKIKQPSPTDCNCETNSKPYFMQSKTFLSIVTALAFSILTFPNYAKVFYPTTEKKTTQVDKDKSKIQTAEFKITGMTCAACENHLSREINKVAGILNLKVSYANSNAIVEFDKSKINMEQVQKAIIATGYKVSKTKIKQ